MLAYHPAFDLYNCIFRMLCLLSATPDKENQFDKLRIWDFYLAFPLQVKEISFPIEFRDRKRALSNINNNSYEKLLDPKRVFEKMYSYQWAAIRCLASYGFIEAEGIERGIIKKTEKEIPNEITIEIENISEINKEIISLLVKEFVSLPLLGQKGLKYRTGLIDYKYDPRS